MNLNNIFHKSFSKRIHLLNDPSNNCFRLFNGAGDNLEGLTIDYYNSYLLIQFFSEKLLQNKNKYLEVIISFYEKNLPDLTGILFKDRIKYKREVHPQINFNELRKSILIYGKLPEKKFYVNHNDCKIYIDLVHGQSTGVFMDMREVRNKLSHFYKKNQVKSLVNLFSYTSMFSIHALKNNVKQTVNIDLSKNVLIRSKENYKLNHLHIDDRDFIYGDSLNWIKRLHKQNRKFDFAVYDPPTFSKNKKKNFSVKKNYSESLIELEKIVNHYVLTAINSFFISEEEYFAMHPQKWKLLFLEHESSDFIFQTKPYLKVGLWKIK